MATNAGGVGMAEELLKKDGGLNFSISVARRSSLRGKRVSRRAGIDG